MAKFQIEGDTENKTLKVTLGNNKVKNASHVSIHRSSDGEFMWIDVEERTEGDDGVAKTTRFEAFASDQEWKENTENQGIKELSQAFLKRNV